MNLLITPIIRVVETAQRSIRLTLPETLAALARDEIESFPALRAHQRHAWHSFLVLIAALALHIAGRSDLPGDEAGWAALLRGLTPDYPGDEPWSLTSPPDKPALLQPPLPSLAELKNVVATPDALDMLVTSRNHDLKAEVMVDAEPDDWLFALVTLQTMQGYYGSGNYGASRLLGAHGNRPSVAIAMDETALVAGRPGLQFRRDIEQLVLLRPEALKIGYAPSAGLGLVWLKPWDGHQSIRISELDPYYIEICRRVRLTAIDVHLRARSGGSKSPRISPIPGALTGDPWAPIFVTKSGDHKVFTATAENGASAFGYARMSELMFGSDRYIISPLGKAAVTDSETGLTILARALVRGEGRTEGYHERRVPLTRKVADKFRLRAAEPIAEAAKKRVEIAGEIQNRVLKAALLALFENGPDQIDCRDDGANRRAEGYLARFDREVDRDFFSELWKEFEEGADGATERAAWVSRLIERAGALIEEADKGASKAVKRRYRARARADAVFYGAPRRNLVLAPFFVEDAA